MSGKAYTMREMKTIVEYLVEKKAFGEVRGRKMWMDFANTHLTVRTWQSLKETFLKRILPDIHNPYYKLTMDQIRSFKDGCDVVAKEKNKLEIVNLDEDSNSNPNGNAENEEEKDQPSTSHANNGEVTAGEDVTCSKVPSRHRDSVDTVIIPTCYETAEDVQRDLESPQARKEVDSNVSTPPKTSLRDLITYSEPLTPMLQEVLNDFASDDSDSDGMKMQIIETSYSENQENGKEPAAETVHAEPITAEPNSEPVNTETVNLESGNAGPINPEPVNSEPVNNDEPIIILDSEDVPPNDKSELKENHTEDSEDLLQPKVLSLKLRKRKGGYEITKKNTAENVTSTSKENADVDPNDAATNKSADDTSEICNTNENHVNEKQNEPPTAVPNKTTPVKSTPNLSNSADTILPNNQEALENSEKQTTTKTQQDKDSGKRTENEQTENDQGIKINTKSKTRKRAISEDDANNSKVIKRLLGSKVTVKEKAVSDTDTINKKLKLTKSKTDFVNEAKQVKQKSDNNKEQTVAKTSTDKAEEKEQNNSISDLSQQNPCLRSVSLFAEQFNKDSYIDSEPDIVPSENKDKVNDKNSKKTDKNANLKINEVVILKSHSESESDRDEVSPRNTNVASAHVAKSQRDKVLANVFGFSSGVVGKKRKKSSSYRKKSSHRYLRVESSSESSEWTSESGSEAYVSPPRGRRNRHSRKYLKPRSARILSLGEEGGLFVMHGKKIYPLVKDGKIVKNYLTYMPESDPEEEENYWKQKYVEERQRVEELKKLVIENQKNNIRDRSPILPARSVRNNQRSPAKSEKNKIIDPEPVAVKPINDEVSDQGQTLKITFAKNNQEVHVEGHWSNIQPVLADVVQIFNKDSKASTPLPNGNVGVPKRLSSDSIEKSVAIVPIDKEVHEKVNKLETEIFKEIEKRDQEEQSDSKEQTEPNVTTRKRASRAIRSSSSSSVAQTTSTRSPRSPKRQKLADEKEEKQTEATKPEEITKNEQKPPEKKPSKSKQKTTAKKSKNDSKPQDTTGVSKDQDITNIEEKENQSSKETLEVETNNKSNVVTRRQTRTPKKTSEETPTTSKSTRSPKAEVQKSSRLSKAVDENEVRYMFPPSKKPTRATSKTTTRDKRYITETPKIFSPPNLSLHSETTQGYQDSDISPPKALLRRKRKLSLSTALNKIRHRNHRNKRKSITIITDDISSDSNTSVHVIAKPVSEDNSLKSDVYRSDSYQLLFSKCRNLYIPLEKIDENSLVINKKKGLDLPDLSSYKDTIDVNINHDFVSSSGNTDGGNSSNVSLPLSPELSIVENLSISKELLNSVGTHPPTLNEVQVNETPSNEIHNQYLMTQIDVSMPLMQQDGYLRQSFQEILNKDKNLNDDKRTYISESLLNKINSVNMEEAPSLSESLDTRLKNLLLESAKKMSIGSEADAIKDTVNEVQKKTKSGKRCSTPRKKKDLPKKKLKVNDPVVEEEYTETCSYGGRNSCPPAIQLILAENNMSKENVDINFDDENFIENVKGRRKKDVIKVKILRPKSRSPKKKKKDAPIHNDSGINETASILSNLGFEESLDLIHNHSETCLLANECMADSVEFVETASTSIISLNTDSSDQSRLVPELFCHNAQDCATKENVQIPSKPIIDNSGETVYYSPNRSDNSLITEDLSDESPSQPTKWYLLSDEETQTQAGNTSNTNFGANLKQIFPITCAVPNLSTITEMSDSSRKPTESDFDSQGA